MSLAIGLVSFWYRSYRDEPPTFPAVLAAFAKAIAPTRSAPAKIANEACGSNNGSVDSLSGHQLSGSLARVKHTRLHGVLWDADDLGGLIDRLLVVVD
jgi:hypothetical protein